MAITIEPMESAHIAEVAEIENLCFTLPWSYNALMSELSNYSAHYFVLIDGETVIGYGGMWHVLDEGHITNIAIRPEYRRMHLAERLLRHMSDDAKAAGITRLSLEVRRSNKAAISLYEKHGFFPVGVRTRYYSDNNEDAILMDSLL